jgi:hypothetical protein
MLRCRTLVSSFGKLSLGQLAPASCQTMSFKQFSSKVTDIEDENKYDMVPIQDIADSIDTTLTPEQKIYVEKIKKKIRGGINSPRCEHFYYFFFSFSEVYFSDCCFLKYNVSHL